MSTIFTLAIRVVFEYAQNPPRKMQRGFGLGATPNYQRQSMTRHLASTRQEGGEP
jgi:hypothetical protein